jgi:hypothetical protein
VIPSRVFGQSRLEGVVVVGELAVEQAEESGERMGRVGLAGDRAFGAGEQVVLQPLRQGRRITPAAGARSTHRPRNP